MISGRTILHIAPHADDETLGCGGALLRHVDVGDAVHWLVVTEASDAGSYRQTLRDVAATYPFAGVHELRLPDARLDTLPLADVIARIGAVVQQIQPAIVYVPHPGDVHTDHRLVFDAAIPCTKWFRFPSVRRVLACETLSETGFGLDPDRQAFRPNVYCDITAQLDRKIAILRRYATELGTQPFPRNEAAIRALATLRGAECGCAAAEAFMLLRERVEV